LGTVSKTWYRLTRAIIAALGKHRLRSAGVRFGKGLVVAGVPVVSMVSDSRIEIGERVVLCSKSAPTALGVNHPIVLRTVAPGAVLVIGDDVGISGGSICAARSVIVGSKTMLGANVTIVDTDFHTLEAKDRRYTKDANKIPSAGVAIGENVFVGANTMILKGVHIGKNAVIGAGSVVTKDVPENAVAAGNPCRVVRILEAE
jgi:acetyltransferase-like isoleucine patch superfamily enzyme